MTARYSFNFPTLQGPSAKSVFLRKKRGRHVIAFALALLVLPAALLVPPHASGQSDPDESQSLENIFQDAITDTLENLVKRGTKARPGAPVPALPNESERLAATSGPVTLQWQAVQDTTSYTVEIDCFGCESTGQWSLDALGRPWHTADNVGQPFYQVNTAPTSQNYRWRVRGVRDGQLGDWSRWSNFSIAPVQQGNINPPVQGSSTTVMPGQTTGTAGAVDLTALRLSGQWTSNQGRTYQLAQAGPRVIWSNADGTDSGSALVRTDGLIDVEQWSGVPASLPARGRITQTDANGRATRIEWENGVAFTRYGAETVTAPSTVPPAAVTAEEGFCCINGQLYQGSNVDCASQNGIFFRALDEAQQMCSQ